MSSSTANEFGFRAWAAIKEAWPKDSDDYQLTDTEASTILEGAFLAFRKARPRYGEQGADALNQILGRVRGGFFAPKHRARV